MGKPTAEQRPPRRTIMLLALLLIIGVFIGAGIAIGLLMAHPPNRIPPGVTILGLDVSGLTMTETLLRVEGAAKSVLHQPITLELEGELWTLDPQQVGIHPAMDTVVAKALAIGRHGSVPERLIDLWYARIGLYDMGMQLLWDDSAIENWLDQLSAEVFSDPVDAKLDVLPDGSIVYYDAVDGRKLRRTETKTALLAASARRHERRIIVPVVPIQPEVRVSDLKALHIRKPIARFTTRFSFNDPNRVHNIHLAAETLHGIVLAPSETFSFNEGVGPRMEALGYKEAPVIIQGELVPDIGGGVCQVSTTLYNAVLLAGLTIDARAPHSIPPTYVPLGMDAAVAYGHLDLQFTNSSNQHVFIAAAVEGNQLTISLFANESRGRFHLESVIEEVRLPQKREVVDPTMRPGEVQVVREGTEGYRVNVWRIDENAGSGIHRTLVAHSSYPARDRIIITGP